MPVISVWRPRQENLKLLASYRVSLCLQHHAGELTPKPHGLPGCLESAPVRVLVSVAGLSILSDPQRPASTLSSLLFIGEGTYIYHMWGSEDNFSSM